MGLIDEKKLADEAVAQAKPVLKEEGNLLLDGAKTLIFQILDSYQIKISFEKKVS